MNFRRFLVLVAIFRIVKIKMLRRCLSAVSRCHPARLAQPHPTTHSYMFKSKEELTPGINAEEYAGRRTRLLDQLERSANSSSVAAFIVGNGWRYATQNVFYPFQQDTNLFYLTGIDEPDVAVMLGFGSNVAYFNFVERKNGVDTLSLFLNPAPSEREELWEGPRCGHENAKNVFHAHQAHRISDFPAHLESRLLDTNAYVFGNAPSHAQGGKIISNTIDMLSRVRSRKSTRI